MGGAIADATLEGRGGESSKPGHGTEWGFGGESLRYVSFDATRSWLTYGGGTLMGAGRRLRGLDGALLLSMDLLSALAVLA